MPRKSNNKKCSKTVNRGNKKNSKMIQLTSQNGKNKNKTEKLIKHK